MGRRTFPIVNLIGATDDDVRDVMVLGESGILACCRATSGRATSPPAGRLEWPNGAMCCCSPPKSRTGCAASST